MLTKTNLFFAEPEHRAQRNDLSLPDLTLELVLSKYPGDTWTIEACEEICRVLLDLDLLTPPD